MFTILTAVPIYGSRFNKRNIASKPYLTDVRCDIIDIKKIYDLIGMNPLTIDIAINYIMHDELFRQRQDRQYALINLPCKRYNIAILDLANDYTMFALYELADSYIKISINHLTCTYIIKTDISEWRFSNMIPFDKAISLFISNKIRESILPNRIRMPSIDDTIREAMEHHNTASTDANIATDANVAKD